MIPCATIGMGVWMEEGGVKVRPYCSCFTLEDDTNESNRKPAATIAAYNTLSRVLQRPIYAAQLPE